MAALKTSERNPDHDKCKSDIFATGMTFLAAACLKDVYHCYDYKTFTVDYDELDHLFKEAERRYSDGFVDKLRLMVEHDEVDRPTYSILCRNRASLHISNSPLKLITNEENLEEVVEHLGESEI